MVSVVEPPLASLCWSESIKFPNQFPANFEAIFILCRRLSTMFQLDSIVSFIFYAVGSFLAVIVPAWMIGHFNKKESITEPIVSALAFSAEVSGNSPENRDAFSQTIKGEEFISDDEYFTADDAEKMQFHEALVASVFSSTTVNYASSSLEVDNSPQVLCEICLENKESWEMFRNDKCSHSFCYECTTNHITAKIQDRVKSINCPAINCKDMLNSYTCRLMIPETVVVQWDELLCLSLIPESSKLYCPFHDCLAMTVNDTGFVVREVNCVSCKRSFCAECNVPWHTEFKCKEFQKLYARKGGKDDKIVKKLAKKKNWQKCPKCRMYVEKTEGCVHITCRCRYQFCYRCGTKWSDSHGANCRERRPT